MGHHCLLGVSDWEIEEIRLSKDYRLFILVDPNMRPNQSQNQFRQRIIAQTKEGLLPSRQ